MAMATNTNIADRIYLSPPHVSREERALLLDAFDSNWIAPLGPHVNAFEREFADAVGVEHAVALSSCTAALHLAMILLGIGPGDEVLTSTMTFAATANAITLRRRLAGVHRQRRGHLEHGPDAAGRRTSSLRRAKSAAQGRPRRRSVRPVRRLRADPRGVRPVRRSHRRGRRRGAGRRLRRPVGRHLRLDRRFSFNGNKIITTGGGGMLACNSQRRGRSGAVPGHAGPRSGAALSTFPSRLQLPHEQFVGGGRPRAIAVLAERVERRRANFEFYREAFDGVPGIDFMPEQPRGRSTRWLTCTTIDPEPVRRIAGRCASGLGGREHRGAAHVEADAPSTGFLPMSGARRGRRPADFRDRESVCPADRVLPKTSSIALPTSFLPSAVANRPLSAFRPASRSSKAA